MKLDIYDFGRKLLDTGDLDPVYIVVHGADLPRSVLERWLLSYWCFYSVGTASWCMDVAEDWSSIYWKRMKTAAASKDYPRATERRHFRGEKAIKAMDKLCEIGIANLWNNFHQAAVDNRVMDADEVMDIVQGWPQFGPWIAFKVADMLERLDIVKVRFSLDTVMYDSPREAANLLWEMESSQTSTELVRDGTIGEWAIERILTELNGYKAPPRYEREINAQEAETILCKWKSYLGGHYHLGEDVEAVRKSLLKFARCETSQLLYAAGTAAKLWPK